MVIYQKIGVKADTMTERRLLSLSKEDIDHLNHGLKQLYTWLTGYLAGSRSTPEFSPPHVETLDEVLSHFENPRLETEFVVPDNLGTGPKRIRVFTDQECFDALVDSLQLVPDQNYETLLKQHLELQSENAILKFRLKMYENGVNPLNDPTVEQNEEPQRFDDE